MSLDLWVAIAISELISMFVIFILWRSVESQWSKIVLTIVLLVPFVGPVMYFLAADNTPPQRPDLRNDGLPYGEYTRRWIAMRPLWQRFYKEKERELREKAKE